MDLNFKEEGEVVMEDWVFYLIKKLYGTTKEKPKNRKKLRCLYKYILNHLTGNIIKILFLKVSNPARVFIFY